MYLHHCPSSIAEEREVRATLDASLALQLFIQVLCSFVVVHVLEPQSSDGHTVFDRSFRRFVFGIHAQRSTSFHLAYALFA